MTTPPPTISTKRRSAAATTHGSRPTPWSAKRPPLDASVTWHGRERLLDTAADRYRDADLPAGQARVLAGLAWWALGADQPDAAVTFAADAVRAAEAIGDPETQLLADSALAAANAIADPTQRQHRRLRRVGPTASLRSLASLPHRRTRSGGTRGSPHAGRDLNSKAAAGALLGDAISTRRWYLSTTSGRPQAASPI